MLNKCKRNMQGLYIMHTYCNMHNMHNISWYNNCILSMFSHIVFIFFILFCIFICIFCIFLCILSIFKQINPSIFYILKQIVPGQFLQCSLPKMKLLLRFSAPQEAGSGSVSASAAQQQTMEADNGSSPEQFLLVNQASRDLCHFVFAFNVLWHT